MIKANELRIGNIVGVRAAFLADVSEREVIGITRSTATIKNWPDFPAGTCANSEVELADLMAIPIDINWLQRFGFRKGGSHTRIELIVWYLSYADSSFLELGEFNRPGLPKDETILEWRIVNEFDSHGALIKDDPMYLHQLQNLYFTLAGEELEVKL